MVCLFFLQNTPAYLAATILTTNLREALEALFFFLFLYLFSSLKNTLLSRVLDHLHLL